MNWHSDLRRDFSDVFVPERDPQVIILIQQHLLHTSVSYSSCLVSDSHKHVLILANFLLRTANDMGFKHYRWLYNDESLLVDIVLDGKQVVGHGLEGELV